MPTIRNNYGWLPDQPDQRDRPYKMRAPGAKTVYKDVDLTKQYKVPPIFDQGSLGSCTGNGWAWHIMYNVLNGHEVKVDALPIPFSRLFIYYQERLRMGTTKYDSGAYIRDGIKAIASEGVCYEKTWPYNISKFASKPGTAAYKEALKFKAVTYERIDNTDKAALFNCLTSGFPIVHGFSVYESFESDRVAKTGIAPMPLKSETMLGGHCTVIVGYELKTDRFKCVNSWGMSWGNGGYYTIPAAYLTNPNLASDFWTCKSIL